MSITSEKQQNKKIRSISESTPQLRLFTYLGHVGGIFNFSKHTLLEIIVSPFNGRNNSWMFSVIGIVDKLHIEGTVFKS